MLAKFEEEHRPACAWCGCVMGDKHVLIQRPDGRRFCGFWCLRSYAQWESEAPAD